jgi:hypothetical protein
MFTQIILGRVSDPAALRAKLDEWEATIRPQAEGYLGTTAGVTDDGDSVAVVRFSSTEAAMRNSERPEQGAWWEATTACFEGPITFLDSEDTITWLRGAAPSSTFVQVMRGRVTDRDRLRELAATAEPDISRLRPEILGSLIALQDDGAFAQAVYFTDEEKARAAEAAAEPDDRIAEFDALLSEVEYYDLRDPWHLGT